MSIAEKHDHDEQNEGEGRIPSRQRGYSERDGFRLTTTACCLCSCVDLRAIGRPEFATGAFHHGPAAGGPRQCVEA